MELKVKWKIDGIFKADANKVFSEIGDYGITPKQLLDKARDENSELHKCFEWDDSVAAEKYRLQQAQTVLRMIVVDTQKKDVEPVRAFSLSSEKSVYKPTRMILENVDEYQLLLKRARTELEAFKRKYASLNELEAIFEAIDNFL